MTTSDLLKRITVNADQCGGKPCIRNIRIRVSDVLDMLANDMSHEEIIKDYPYLEEQDIKAVLAYAARQSDHPIFNVNAA